MRLGLFGRRNLLAPVRQAGALVLSIWTVIVVISTLGSTQLLFEAVQLVLVLAFKLTVAILEGDHVLVAFLILKRELVLLMILLLEFPIRLNNVVLSELAKHLELVEKAGLAVHESFLLLQLLS